MNDTPLCLRCSTPMEEGFISDTVHGGARRQRWVEGAPSPSVWGGVKTSFRKQYLVATYRCPGCGALESFARGVRRDSTSA